MSLNRRALRALNNRRVIVNSAAYQGPRASVDGALAALHYAWAVYCRIPATPVYTKPFDKAYWRAYRVRTGRVPWRAMRDGDRWRREKTVGEHVAWCRAEWHKASKPR